MGIHLKDIIEGTCRKSIQDKNGKDIDDTYLKKTGDVKDNIVTFESADNKNPTSWTDVATLTTGEKHSSIFNKISIMFKNIRWIYKLLGTASLSGIGTGTVTNAIVTINNLVGAKNNAVGGKSNIQYSYPENGYANNSLGADSLKDALKDATEKITDEVCKLNTGMQDVSGLKFIDFGTYDGTAMPVDDCVKDIFAKIPLTMSHIYICSFMSGSSFRLIVQSHPSGLYASAILFSYAGDGITVYKEIDGKMYKDTTAWTRTEI